MNPSRNLVATALTAALVLLLAAPAFATFPGDNGRLAFTNTTSGSVIETVEPDGSDVDTLTSLVSAQGPSWSPDGTKIVYSQDNDIWIMDADGSDAEQLTDTSGLNERRPTFSPDGTRIVYSDNTDYDLHVMDADGSDQDTITPDGFTDAYGPDWSPDGTRIVFTGTNGDESDGLFTVAPDGTDVQPVADPEGGSYGSSWSPDGQQIAFYGCNPDCRLYLSDADGSGDALPISDAAEGLFGPAWSPDGTLIAALDGDSDIVLLDEDGDVTPIVEDDQNRGGLRWQTLPHAPAVTTGEATGVTQTAATLNGVVNPATRAFDTTYRFEYGPTTEYGSATDEVTLDGTTDDQAVSAALQGLQPGTTLHYRLVATNGRGTTAGEDRTLTTAAPTPPPPPTTCPAGQVGVPPQCVAIIAKEPAKMQLLRATIDRRTRTLSILAPITRRASGTVAIQLQAAGRFTRFTAPIDEQTGRVRVTRRIPASQARLGTGILTIAYDGDADTRPMEIRSRAANQKAALSLERPKIVDNRLQASGTVNPRARGKVRIVLQYQVGNETIEIRRAPRIRAGGQWGVNSALSKTAQDQIANRVGTVHSYTQFTGYMPWRIRGEQRSYEVLGPR
ncbi:MAG TPA: DPP IV N-terminal domain-containing protein [Solirubrobacteraceae bacterium]